MCKLTCDITLTCTFSLFILTFSFHFLLEKPSQVSDDEECSWPPKVLLRDQTSTIDEDEHRRPHQGHRLELVPNRVRFLGTPCDRSSQDAGVDGVPVTVRPISECFNPGHGKQRAYPTCADAARARSTATFPERRVASGRGNIHQCGYRASFVDALPRRLRCAFCGEALRRPVATRCGHRMCHDCWKHLRRYMYKPLGT